MKLLWPLALLATTLVVNLSFATEVFEDKPCKARAIFNRSVVCVCTAEYCDTVIRETPECSTYYKYVSSEAGLRFHKTKGELQAYDEESTYDATLVADTTKTYQTIKGFGTAITDSTAINWKNLTDPELMNKLIESYFGPNGSEYSMLRVPIGGSDYSTHGYAYNDYPENDAELSNFTLADEDYNYKIPMIKACMKVAKYPIDIVSSTWSPPKWMKTNYTYSGNSRLKKEYFKTYAKYHLRFMEEYNKTGIPIWGLTTTNEPLDAMLYNSETLLLNDLGWTINDLGDYVLNHLGPTIRNSSFKNVKIMTGDDQRYAMPIYWSLVISAYPEVINFLDGVAIHNYFNSISPPVILTQLMEQYPDKFVLSTEASAGATTDVGLKVDLGSWARAEGYFKDIIEILNYNVIGWIDWNACLNLEGGPSYVNATSDSTIIVDPEAGEFLKQPTFYAQGHASKFVPPGSVRIHVSEENAYKSSVKNVAFLTPENTVVFLIYNGDAERIIRIKLGDKEAVIDLDRNSFTSVELSNE